VDAMMANLKTFSDAATRPPPPSPEEEALLRAEAEARKHKLEAATGLGPLDLPRFMGKWYVVASQPTFLERGGVNAVEEYAWNEGRQCIDVTFTMQSGSSGKETVLYQRAYVVNNQSPSKERPAQGPLNTQWAIHPKVGPFYSPVGLTYLVAFFDQSAYETAIIGVPDRSYVWVMARSPSLPPPALQALIHRCERLGYDPAKILPVVHNQGAPPPPAASEAS